MMASDNQSSGGQAAQLSTVIMEAQSGFASGKRDPAGVVQVRMNNVSTDGNLDLSNVLRVPAQQKNLQKYFLCEGDVLFNSTNSPKLVGKSAVFGGHHEPVVFSNHFVRLRVDESKLDSGYLARWLALQWKQRVFEGLCTQWVNQASVRKEDLLNLRIPLPPLAEQRRIAAILDKADAIRRKREEAIRLADEFLRSAFLEMFGDPVTNPKGWPDSTLGDIGAVQGGLQVTSRRATNPIEIPYLRVANVFRDRLELDEVKTMRVTPKEVERVSLETDDLLLVEGHGNCQEIGRSSVWDGSVDPCVHQNHLIRVRIDQSIAVPRFISMHLNSPGGRRQLVRFGKTTSGLNTISTSNVRATKVLLPPVQEQKMFLAVAQKVETLIGQLSRHAVEGAELFESLAQHAFRGDLSKDIASV